MLLDNPIESFEQVREHTVTVGIQGLDRYDVGLFGDAVLCSTAHTGDERAMSVRVGLGIRVAFNDRRTICNAILYVCVIAVNTGIKDVHCYTGALARREPKFAVQSCTLINPVQSLHIYAGKYLAILFLLRRSSTCY